MKRLTIYAALLGLMLAIPARAAADPRQQLEQLAVALEQIGKASDAARFRDAVNALSPEEIDAIYGDTDLTPLAEGLYRSGKSTAEVLSSARAARDALDAARVRSLAQVNGGAPVTTMSGPNGALPTAPWPTAVNLCPVHAVAGSKSDTHEALDAMSELTKATKALEQAEIVYSLGKGIWDGLSRACKQVIIVLGAGGNSSLACLPVDIVFGVLEFAVAEAKWGVEFWQQNRDRIDACDAAVETAEKAGTYTRLGHVHADIETFKAEMQARLEAMTRKADLAMKVLLEGDLHEGSVNRLKVNYTVRLEESCDAAQRAIDESAAAGYPPTPGPQSLHDQGRKLMPTDPRRAFDLCQEAYRRVTTREPVRRR